MTRKGFTLIELLIVVAIIAILAAIAVPNFLEAQTRAKVSRVKADMRTIATAIEAYTVDYNRHPLDWVEWWGAGILVGAEPSALRQDWMLAQLTSPVAYLTSIPVDPFVRRSRGGSWGWIHTWYMTRQGYGEFRNDPNDPSAIFYGPRSNYQWLLGSQGPDYIPQLAGDFLDPRADNVLYYDATNGSKSRGDIYYYGPGGGINPGPVTSR